MQKKIYSARQVIQDRGKGVQFLNELLENVPKNSKDLEKRKRAFCAKEGTTPFLNRELVVLLGEVPMGAEGRKQLEKILTKRAVRTISGVTPIGILTKPWPCPGQCVYCPTEDRMPKSYLSSQPAAARALRNKFHPYKQVHNRIIALEESGHPVSKLEVIVMGGTWSFLPKKYQSWYVRGIFQAANEMGGKPSLRKKHSLKQEQKENETADHRVIGLTLETRPDWITEEELVQMRKLGCTRIEIGVQTLDDLVSKKTKRGHLRKHVAEATKLIREYGFKFCYHLMPGLPGSTIEGDLQMLCEVFENSDFKPDFIKIYPCQVLPNSELANWWKEGKYKPLDDASLVKLLLKFKESVPPWTRIMRLLRDIPVGDTLDGVKFSNLRQIIKSQPKKLRELVGEDFDIPKDWPCHCIRCREIGFISKQLVVNSKQSEVVLKRRDYQAAGGIETFLSFESEDESVIYALLRLRKPNKEFIPKYFRSVLKKAALIREVHSYGSEISVGEGSPFDKLKAPSGGQHRGLGKKLIIEAEQIAKDEWGMKKMTIIAGVGTREYYRKFGYEEKCTYMVKSL